MNHQDIWLDIATPCPSPNCDERADGEVVSLLVIHNISLPPGEFGGPWITDLFMNRLDPKAHPYFADIAAMQVSAHLLIRRDGEIIQYVPLNKRAWHAGPSCYCGKEACNNFSIGIELEGTDTTPYTQEQYSKLAEVGARILALFPDINNERIAGHSDIAPERKTDPGPAFDWDRFRNLLDTELQKTA